MSRPISRAAFAREAGVSKPAISKACKSGALRDACDRDRIDAAHPAAIAYLAAQARRVPAVGAPVAEQAAPSKPPTDGAPTPPPKPARSAPSKPTPVAKTAPERVAAPTPDPPPAASDDKPKPPKGTDQELSGYAVRLRPLVRVYGTARAFRDWLLALKEIEAIAKARLDNGERAGRLVTRALVQTHLFGALDGMSRLLLTDSPKTIARRAYAMAKSGATAEEGEAMVREIISSQLVHVRDKIVKALEQTHAQTMRDALEAAEEDSQAGELDDADE